MTKRIYTGCIITLLLMAAASCKKPDFESEQQAQATGTISDYLSNNFDLSLFGAAVRKAGLMDSLDKATASFTVMAPTNSALNKDSIFNAGDFDTWTKDSLLYFVRTHILPVKLFYGDIPLSSDNRYTNLNGVQLYFSRSTARNNTVPFAVNGVNVIRESALGTSTSLKFGATQLNGVVYPLLNTIKVYPGTVQAFLQSRPYFSHLIAGLKKFDYWERMGGDGPFTVYAPLDSSFERRGMTLDSINRMDSQHYDPVVFGGYFLTPNHVFVMDIAQLPPVTGVLSLPFQTASPNYKVIMCQSAMGSGVGVVTAASASTSSLVVVSANAAYPYGSQGTLFLGEQPGLLSLADMKGTYINYTCANGIVHVMADILVMPGKVTK
ncbi:MAG: fasciclin domain-containing protein [Chitinophaga sp.]|uniref:fasciclin domain-containing protein n=1 Tax=Chitinophaga sp. TaxID=1869181 RepID=UPI001B0C0095|nr:fasciclin domain-containing protein [Chitinophaga sp.]MBO9731286.1 fasciclin domain-containing protein [Chitinophaga sp.]